MPQHEVRHDGSLLARGDLWVRDSRTLLEYDGSDHLEAQQYRDDRRRERRLVAAGWTRHGYTSSDVLSRAIGIVRDADRATGREHRPERVRPWHAMLARSLFTAAGTTRVQQRWGGAEAPPSTSRVVMNDDDPRDQDVVRDHSTQRSLRRAPRAAGP